jgi:hypothetical protein
VSSTDVDTWVLAFAEVERAQPQVDAWVDRTAAAIRAEVTPISDPELAVLVDTAVAEHWLAFLDRITLGTPFALPPSAAALALELARRHHDLPVLLAVYRAAQQASWSYATEVVAQAPSGLDHEALLVRFWSEAGAWLDASVEESILLHQRESRRIQQRGDAQRYDVVRRLLAGEGQEPRELSAVLGGYAVSGSHLALILHARVPDGLGGLEALAARMAGLLGGGRPLVVQPGGRELWCWVAARGEPAAETVEALQRLADPALVRIGLGGPGHGLDGFVAAYGEALAARRVALAPGRSRPVAAYPQVAALALIAQDPAGAERFARRTLGGLADPGAAKLRATVRALLETGGVEQVARALGVHKNTVRYRAGQAERLLGRPLRERSGDLLLALDYLESFLPPE